MRPLAFSPDSLRKLLLRDKIATLPDLKRALGSDVDLVQMLSVVNITSPP